MSKYPYRHRERKVGLIDTFQGKASTQLPTSSMTLWFDAAYAYTDAGKTTLCSNNGVDTCYTLKDLASSPTDLVQASAESRPVWYSSGPQSKPYLTFNGQTMSNALTWAEPITLYIVMKQNAWAGDKGILGSASSGYRGLSQNWATPELCLVGGDGTNVGSDGNLAVDSWGLVALCWNASSSWIKINSATATSINITETSPAGFMLGNAWFIGGGGNFSACEIVAYSSAHDPLSGDGLSARNYLNTKYSLY